MEQGGIPRFWPRSTHSRELSGPLSPSPRLLVSVKRWSCLRAAAYPPSGEDAEVQTTHTPSLLQLCPRLLVPLLLSMPRADYCNILCACSDTEIMHLVVGLMNNQKRKDELLKELLQYSLCNIGLIELLPLFSPSTRGNKNNINNKTQSNNHSHQNTKQ